VGVFVGVSVLVGVLEGVLLGTRVDVFVAVDVFVGVCVLVGVLEGVLVGTSVDVLVGVAVRVGVDVLVAVLVLVAVFVGVRVGVRVLVAVCVGVAVGTSVAVLVGVRVLVAVRVGVGSGTSNPITSTGELRWVVLPSPSWPAPFSPQHLIVPSMSRAHVWPPRLTPPPPLSATMFASGRPPNERSTSTGVCRLPPDVPSPTWPASLNPQHFAPAAEVTAHPCMPPTPIPDAGPLSAMTSTGPRGALAVPSPSCPPTSHPQHLAVPVERRAHEWYRPVPTSTAPLPRSNTFTGVVDPVVVPSPSWPLSLRPQHRTWPAVVMAQVWPPKLSAPLADIVVTGAMLMTVTGIDRSVEDPSPSCPALLRPQQRASPVVRTAQV
jgi:hypothetical protein